MYDFKNFKQLYQNVLSIEKIWPPANIQKKNFKNHRLLVLKNIVLHECSSISREKFREPEILNINSHSKKFIQTQNLQLFEKKKKETKNQY